MKNFSTWLLACFVAMFWGFRIMVALMAERSSDFIVAPFNLTVEKILLFVVLACFVLIVKRKMVGALIYLLAYGMYFGTDVVNKVTSLFKDSVALSINDYTSLVISLIGIIIPIAVLMDLLVDRNRKEHPSDKKTDWFYKNEEYDRKLDDRADKNNYRTM